MARGWVLGGGGAIVTGQRAVYFTSKAKTLEVPSDVCSNHWIEFDLYVAAIITRALFSSRQTTKVFLNFQV